MVPRILRYILPVIALICGDFFQLSGQQSTIDTTGYIPYYYDDALNYNFVIAASQGLDSELIRMSKKGADTNFATSEGATALVFAVANNHLSTTKILLSLGADVNIITYKNESPLLIAVFNNNFEIAETLIRSGADVGYKDNFGATPLHYASFHGMTEIADLLIYYEADVDIKTKDGTTPLMASILNGNNAVAELLVKNGANMEARDENGFTPFLVAAQSGNLEFAQYLKEQGVDIYEKNSYKWNALSLAIKTSQVATVKELVAFGDGWNTTHTNSVNPFKIAAETRNPEILDILENAAIDGHYRNSINQVSLSLTARFTGHGYFNGAKISFMEPVNHIGFAVGFDAKPTYSAQLYKVSEDSFYQLREKSYLAYFGAVKEFAITDRLDKWNLNATSALYAGYLFSGKIIGPPIANSDGFKLIPSLGLEFASTNYGVFANIEYMETQYHGVGRVWTRIGIRVNTYFEYDYSPLKEIKWK